MNDEPEVFGMNENANIAFQVFLSVSIDSKDSDTPDAKP